MPFQEQVYRFSDILFFQLTILPIQKGTILLHWIGRKSSLKQVLREGNTGGLHASTVPPGFPLPHILGFATLVEYSHDLDEQRDIIVVNRTY